MMKQYFSVPFMSPGKEFNVNVMSSCVWRTFFYGPSDLTILTRMRMQNDVSTHQDTLQVRETCLLLDQIRTSGLDPFIGRIPTGRKTEIYIVRSNSQTSDTNRQDTWVCRISVYGNEITGVQESRINEDFQDFFLLLYDSVRTETFFVRKVCLYKCGDEWTRHLKLGPGFFTSIYYRPEPLTTELHITGQPY